jgi:hypothetical protein
MNQSRRAGRQRWGTGHVRAYQWLLWRSPRAAAFVSALQASALIHACTAAIGCAGVIDPAKDMAFPTTRCWGLCGRSHDPTLQRHASSGKGRQSTVPLLPEIEACSRGQHQSISLHQR